MKHRLQEGKLALRLDLPWTSISGAHYVPGIGMGDKTS